MLVEVHQHTVYAQLSTNFINPLGLRGSANSTLPNRIDRRGWFICLLELARKGERERLVTRDERVQ